MSGLETAAWIVGGMMGVFVLDRALLWAEERGWIYYRRRRPGRGAIGYHMLEMSSVFNPSHKVVQEIQVKEEQQEDESGDPPARTEPMDPTEMEHLHDRPE